MKNVKKKVALITSVVFLFVAGGGTGAYAYYKTPVSYLSLDINPSVELGVNAFDKVVQVEGYNTDGEKILEGIDVTGSNIEDAVKILIESANDNGYIEEDGSTVVSLTSETDNTDIATKIENDAEDGANEALEEKGGSAVIHTDNVSISMNEEARALGITPGKLNLIRKLQAVDSTATVEQYKDTSVKNIMKTIKDNKEKGTVDNQDESIVNNQDESIVDNQDESIVDNQYESAVDNQDESTVNRKDESSVNRKEKNGISIKNECVVGNQEGGVIDKQDKNVENKPDESKVSKRNKSEVENDKTNKGQGKN